MPFSFTGSLHIQLMDGQHGHLVLLDFPDDQNVRIRANLSQKPCRNSQSDFHIAISDFASVSVISLLPRAGTRSTRVFKISREPSSLGLGLLCNRIAIWERKWTVVGPLLLLCLAHWGLLYHGIIIVRATYDSETDSCVVNQTNSAVLKFTFFASKFPSLPIYLVHYHSRIH